MKRRGAMDLHLRELDDAERLGRSVVSSSAAERARKKGLIERNVFLIREEDTCVSVDRMDHAPVEVMAGLAEGRAQAREPPKESYGWAVVLVRDARSDGRPVRATPLEENPFHTDIDLNLADLERRDLQKQHALQLASHSAWLEAP